MCLFLQLSVFEPQRNVLSLPQQLNCVFNDVIRLDFVKFKSVMIEYTHSIAEKRRVLAEESKD